ncbi:MAG: NACHT domain-containing protein [Anaerolineae bacterium]|jgi:hypothetical protein|nr:NACHT domain-containing protein [Anaerolineae bacterium]MBT7075225.1 NACHT domain-containing protein [Anaerolineae bacterium]MBT7781838.1 NACHT domain-containing protein [Anaerolineae bacterium]
MNSSKFSIDAISFWVGAAVASAFWLMLGRARPLLKQIRENWQKKRAAAALRASSNVEIYYRGVVLKKAQGMHLAAPLFSLEEIIIPPTFLAPPPQGNLGSDEVFKQDQTNSTIPYLPQDSTLASFYRTDFFTLSDALAGEANLVILGNPGMGKSVALAHTASLVSKGDPSMGALNNFVPFLLHVADLSISDKEPKDILDPIIEFTSESASLLNASRLPKFIRLNFNSGRALLLLDGLDEIPPNDVKKVVAYIEKLLKIYPKTRIITTSSHEYLDKLTQLNFIPLTLRAWNKTQQEEFLSKWGNLWKNHVALEAWVQSGPEQVDPILLNTWLKINLANFSPLELTLKTWGAYAGDGRGASALDAIDTHLRRLSPSGIPIEALEMLAMQASLTIKPVFDSRKANDWVKSFEPPEEVLIEEESIVEADIEEDEESEVEKEKKKEQSKAVAQKRDLLDRMAESGLLAKHRNHQMRFTHPVFAGFLAGRNLSNYNIDERLTGQPFWSGKTLSMHYFAANSTGTNAIALVETLLKTADPILERNLLLMGNWLKNAPRKTKWRGKILTALATTLQDDTQPLGLRGQIISSLARSEDPSVGALFRQLLQSDSAYIIQLAALGSGLMQDKKSVQALSQAFMRTQNIFTLSAVALALAAIGTDDALNALATALMQGEENLRRASAEAFANHPGEGWDTLKEALEIDDILVRRSAIYGLARIDEPWAKELLTQTQVEDKEWAVRDIATAILEQSQNKAQFAPRKLAPPAESPWLIAFAGEQGMGIPAGSPATDILLLALKGEDTDQSLAALAYLLRTPSEGVINALYHAMYGKNIATREAVFLALVGIAASGVKLPEPRSFGLA